MRTELYNQRNIIKQRVAELFSNDANTLCFRDFKLKINSPTSIVEIKSTYQEDTVRIHITGLKNLEINLNHIKDFLINCKILGGSIFADNKICKKDCAVNESITLLEDTSLILTFKK
jgi:hypothetical protein